MTRDVRAVSFDGLGALVDWDAAVRAYAARLIHRIVPSRQDQSHDEQRPRISVDDWVASWRAQYLASLTDFRPFRALLADSVDRTLRHFGLEQFVDDGRGLPAFLAEWPAVDGAPRLLRSLARRFRLALLVNGDAELVATCAGRAQAPFSVLLAAEDLGAYKPSPLPFARLLDELGLAAHEVVHVAVDPVTDLAPAAAAGLRTLDARGRTLADLAAELLGESPNPC